MIRNDKEYLGVQAFNSRLRKSLQGDERLIAVWWAEDVAEFFVCDGEDGLRNLQLLYAEEEGTGPMQAFKEVDLVPSTPKPKEKPKKKRK